MTTIATPIETTFATQAPHVVESWRTFADWAAETLGLELSQTSDGFCLYEPHDSTHVLDEAPAKGPPTKGSGFLLAALKPLRRRRETTPDPMPIALTASSPLEVVRVLLQMLADLETAPTIAPADQPSATHEITERLFGGYQIDGGKIHLAGCRLDVMRLVRQSRIAQSPDGLTIEHTYSNPIGEPLQPALVEQLGLSGPMRGGGKLAPINRQAEPSFAAGDLDDRNPIEVATANVMIKRATGCLQATINGVGLNIPFDDWARTIQSPLAVCPESGRETYHLTAIDDGRVVAAESTGICQTTGRRLLLTDLATCTVTGKTLATELCDVCPVSGETIDASQFAVCPKCNQRVSTPQRRGGDCAGCRQTRPVRPQSPERAALLSAAPILKRWRQWRVSETSQVRILTASTLWRRLVIVFDRQTGEPLYAATRRWWGGGWSPSALAEISERS